MGTLNTIAMWLLIAAVLVGVWPVALRPKKLAEFFTDKIRSLLDD